MYAPATSEFDTLSLAVALPFYPRRWRAARKTVMLVAPTIARVPMRPRVSRADAPPARVRRASAKTHAPSAKTIAAVDLARVGWDLVQKTSST